MYTNRPPHQQRKATGERSGVAAVEMALVLPALLTVVFGTFTAAQLVYHRKTMVIAAHEGIRLASQRNMTSADVQSRVNAILVSRRIDDAVITISPTEIAQASPGEMIELTVQADFTGFGLDTFGSAFVTPVRVNAAILRE